MLCPGLGTTAPVASTMGSLFWLDPETVLAACLVLTMVLLLYAMSVTWPASSIAASIRPAAPAGSIASTSPPDAVADFHSAATTAAAVSRQSRTDSSAAAANASEAAPSSTPSSASDRTHPAPAGMDASAPAASGVASAVAGQAAPTGSSRASRRAAALKALVSTQPPASAFSQRLVCSIIQKQLMAWCANMSYVAHSLPPCRAQCRKTGPYVALHNDVSFNKARAILRKRLLTPAAQCCLHVWSFPFVYIGYSSCMSNGRECLRCSTAYRHQTGDHLAS